MTSITKYFQNASNLARTNRFLFHVPLPPIRNMTFGEQFWLNCYAINIPGVEIQTEQVEIHSWFAKQFPIGKKYPEVQASFYLSEDHAERNIFIAWQNMVVGKDNVLQFRNNYITDAIIFQLTPDTVAQDNKEVSLSKGSVAGVTLTGIYPTRVGDVKYSYESSNQIGTFDVTFSIYSWTPMRATAENMTLPKTEIPKTPASINPNEIIWNS